MQGPAPTCPGSTGLAHLLQWTNMVLVLVLLLLHVPWLLLQLLRQLLKATPQVSVLHDTTFDALQVSALSLAVAAAGGVAGGHQPHVPVLHALSAAASLVAACSQAVAAAAGDQLSHVLELQATAAAGLLEPDCSRVVVGIFDVAAVSAAAATATAAAAAAAAAAAPAACPNKHVLELPLTAGNCQFHGCCCSCS